jgi:hypothetical protein
MAQIDPPLKKYYDYLRTKGADVPGSYESFESTLKNEDAARKFHTYAVQKGFDAPKDYNSFANTFSLRNDGVVKLSEETVKKKDETFLPGSSTSSLEPNQLEKDLAKAPGRIHTFQDEDVDDQNDVIDRIGLNGEDLTKLNKTLSENLKYQDGKPVRWQDLPANELSQMLTGMSLKDLQKKPAASDRPSEFSFDRITQNMREAKSIEAETEGAQAVVQQIEKDRRGETTPLEKASSAAAAFNTPFVDMVAAAPKVVGVVTNQMERLLDRALGKEEKDRTDIEDNAFYSVGDWIDKKALEVGITATDPKLNDSFAYTALPNAFGSALSLIMTGGTGALGAKTGAMLEKAATSGPVQEAAKSLAKTLSSRPVVAGGAVMGTSEFDQAIAAGVPEEQAFKVFLANYAIGQTEGFQLERALAKINKITDGRIISYLKAGAAGSIEEATQEAVQTYLTNKVAEGSYDPTRDSFQDLVKSMGAGAFVGFILPGLGMAMEKMTPEQRTATQEVLNKQFQESKIEFETKQEEKKNGLQQQRVDAVQEGTGQEGQQTNTPSETQQGPTGTGADGQPVPTQQQGPEGNLIPPGTTVELTPDVNKPAPDANKSADPVIKSTENVPETTGDEIKQPVTELSVDPKRFQNREEEFSEKSVDNIVQAVLQGKFDKGEFDPIRVWKDPKDNKTYVLAGHSRTEAFKRLQTMLEKGEIPEAAMEKMKAQGFSDFKTIPAKNVSNKSEQDAIEYAKERSNVMGTQETDLARAKLWKEKRGQGDRDAGIRESIKGNTTQEKFSYLKENGKTWDAIKAVQETGQEANKRRVYQIGEFIGDVRKRFPELSDSHENEMFDYLFEGSGKKITNRSEFIQRIDNTVNNVGFQENTEAPLNLESRVTRGSNETEALNARDEALQEIRSLEKERANKKNPPQSSRLNEINREIERLSRDLIRLNENIDKAKQGDRQQIDMFAADKKYAQSLPERNQRSGDLVPRKKMADGYPVTDRSLDGIKKTLIKAGKLILNEDGSITVKQNSGYPSQLFKDLTDIAGNQDVALNEYLKVKKDDGAFKKKFGEWENAIMKKFGRDGREYSVRSGVPVGADPNEFMWVSKDGEGRLVLVFNDKKLARDADFSAVKESYRQQELKGSPELLQDLYDRSVNKLRDLKLHLIHQALIQDMTGRLTQEDNIRSLKEVDRISKIDLAKDYFGEPLVAQHSGPQGIDMLKKPGDKGYVQSDIMTGSAGIYFSRSQKQGKYYSEFGKNEENKPAKGKDIYYAYLRTRNPYYMTDPRARADYELESSETISKKDVEGLKAKGYDSVIWDKESSPKHEIVVFDPDQVQIIGSYNEGLRNPPPMRKKKKDTLQTNESKAFRAKTTIASDPANFSVKDGVTVATTPEGEKLLARYNRMYKRHEDLSGKRYEGEQASTTKFYEVPVGAPTKKPKATRVQVAPIFGAAVKKLRDIMLDLSTSVPNTIFYSKTPIKGRRSIGSYSPSNAAIAIKYKGDISVTAHELGHSLDDRFGIMQGISGDPNQVAIEKELRELSQWGSNPPKGHPDKKAYRMGEGIAEYIRAYLVNPAAAGSRYPAMTKFFKQQLPADVIINVEKFGTDIRNYAGLSGHGKIMANTQFEPEKQKGGFMSFWKPSSTNKENFRITWVDRLANKFTNDKTYFEKSVDFLAEAQGTTLKPAEDPIMLARVLMGSNEKIDNIFEKGLINARNQRSKDKVTNAPMTFEWLLQPFENTDQETLLQEQQEAITYMIAERTVELAKRFQREDVLTGIGAGIFKDLDVARERIAEHNNLPAEKKARIEEAVRRYREYSDRVLQYLVGKGRLSQEQYNQIKADNVQYVALNRILEAAPGEEIIVYRSSKGNKAVGSVTRLAYAIKGSSQMIKNPYESLVHTTVKSVKEADRNEVMQAFRELFRVNRKMGQGDPVITSQVARPATSKDKNTVQIFVDGQSEYWQLDDDVYQSVKGLFDTAKTLPIILTALPKLLRWTVTNFPVFALRNRIRDIQQRFIVSDTKAYKGFDIYRDKATKELNKDLFQIFGGGQAGYYTLNDDFYYRKLDQALKDLAGDKRTVFTIPQKFVDGYNKLLTESERATRLEEYRSAFREAKEQGMDDYNAAIFAAFKARDLLDFSVAGEWLRVINQMIPFSNAAVQGLKKTINSASDDPIGFGIRFTLYAVLPSILLRLLVHQLGDDEEYENLPDYRRDLFYNIPIGPDMWISIPKPFELGVLSTGVERFVSKMFLNQDKAFNGYGRSLVRSIIPVDEAAFAGGYRPLIEVITNYDFFRDKTIIPPDEVGLELQYRETGYASRLGQAIQSTMGVDARNADYFIKSSASYFGDLALRVSDIGREDSRYNFNLTMTGLLRNDPVYESKDVQWVMKFVEKNGVHWSDPFLMELKGMVHDYFNTPISKERDKVGDAAREYARMVRETYETDDYYKREENSPDTGN